VKFFTVSFPWDLVRGDSLKPLTEAGSPGRSGICLHRHCSKLKSQLEGYEFWDNPLGNRLSGPFLSCRFPLPLITTMV
jgi:hypothetical protein